MVMKGVDRYSVIEVGTRSVVHISDADLLPKGGNSAMMQTYVSKCKISKFWEIKFTDESPALGRGSALDVWKNGHV